MKLFNRNTKAGFTLVELIVVIAILGILAGVAIPVYSGYIKKANQAADNTLLGAVNTAFAAACVDNGEYNLKALKTTPTATLAGGKVVSVTPYNESFKTYFAGNENSEFKYYTKLTFVDGAFTGADGAASLAASETALKDSWDNTDNAFKGHEEEALKQFDQIARIFGGDLASQLLSQVSSIDELAPLVNAFGMNGLAAITSLGADELSSLIPGYDEMDDSAKAAAIQTVKGNLAMKYLANDAATQTTASVMSGLNGLATAISTATLPDEEALSWFLKNADSDTLANFNNADDGDKADIVANYMNEKDSSSAMGLLFTRGQAVAIENAIGDGSALADGGASKIGAIYALAVGYQQSKGNDPLSTGSGSNMITTITSSLSDGNAFLTYCGSEAATASVDAYLSAMTVLSNKDIDLTSSTAYSEQAEYIYQILGITSGDD